MKINDYTITNCIYDSMRTSVFRAKSERDQRRVILKVLKAEYPSVEALSLFRQEFEIMSHLKDVAGVVEAYSLEKHQNSLVICLEDFGGESLSNWLGQERKFTQEELLSIGIKIAETLEAIHEHHIIHKDLNPANIILNPATGLVKIIDFGVATKLSRQHLAVKGLNVMEGTLAYMSPEQTGRMNRSLDYRSDYYSLGATLYELFTGVLPFPSQDPMELVHCHIAKKPESPLAVNPDLSEMLSEIILKLLAKTAEARYQSDWGIKADLEECRLALQNGGSAPFKLGRKDISDRFQIPQKLYGREGEIDALLAAFARVAMGRSELVLVAGHSGIGKSSLVHEIHKPMATVAAYFCEGKFDQFQRHMPYSAIIQACRDLAVKIMGEPEKQLALWKTRLTAALGANAQIITSLIPELELLIGPQAAVPELSATETQNRFHITFRKFIGVFATCDSPLVFFIDDLQWSDTPSIELISNIFTTREIEGFLLVGAYRSNEVEQNPALANRLTQVQKSGTVETVTLEPLDLETVSHQIADTLDSAETETKPLAEWVHMKTGGNPFYTNELLNGLHKNGLIFFSKSKKRWDWELERFNTSLVSADLAGLILDKLQKCSSKAFELLKLAACIGNKFDLRLLSLLGGESIQDNYRLLLEVIGTDAIIMIDAAHGFFPVDDHHGQLSGHGNIEYRFQHDRVRQTVYAQMADSQAIHLKLGYLMLADFTEEQIESRIIDIVQQLNKGKELLETEAEARKLGGLNLRAGIKARQAAAYRPALEYFGVSKELLAEDAWENQYELSFRLHMEYSECAYICSEFESAESISKMLMEKARTDLEKAEVCHMQGVQYAAMQKLDLSRETLFLGLKLLEFEFISTPGDADIGQEIEKAQSKLAGRNILDLVDEPVLSDPAKKMVMLLIPDVIFAAYVTGNQNLLAYATLKGTNLCLEYGNGPETVFVYNLYALLLTSIFNDFKTAHEIGQLSIALDARFNDMKVKAVNLFTNVLFIQWLNSHPQDYSKNYKKAMEIGLETGDLLYASNSCINILAWDPSLTLEQKVEQGRQHVRIQKNAGYQFAIDLLQIHYHFFLNLRGLTTSPYSLSSDTFDEDAALKRYLAISYQTGVAGYHIFKLEVYYFHGQFDQALTHVEKAEEVLSALVGQRYIADFCFFAFLTCTALLSPGGDVTENTSIRERIQREYERMKLWSDHCPGNFLHLELLMQAEMARLGEEFENAALLYDRAIQTANEHKFPYDAAICLELAGKFYLGKEMKRVAAAYLTDASYVYQLWGATAKVENLQSDYPELLSAKAFLVNAEPPPGRRQKTTTAQKPSAWLDLESIMKAARTLSGEIVLKRLLKKMIHIVVENAGAEQGFLLLPTEGDWLVEAESHVERSDVIVLQSLPLEESEQISGNIMHFVARTWEKVVLHDASQAGNFTGDSVILNRQSRSILCMPLVNRGKLTGILYLENNLVTGAFTAERLEVLDLLSSQMAVSIENSLLYNYLGDKVAERTRELEHEISIRKKAEKALKEKSRLIEEQRDQLERFSRVDALTDIPNRRHFEEVLDKECRRARRESNPLSIAMIDIDYFKQYNDTYGHVIGDACLKDVAQALQNECQRPGDFVARYGGEEFVVILANSDLNTARVVTERMKESVERLEIMHSSSLLKKYLSISIGLASCIPDDGDAAARLLARADEMLYRAKAEGRDRIVTALLD